MNSRGQCGSCTIIIGAILIAIIALIIGILIGSALGSLLQEDCKNIAATYGEDKAYKAQCISPTDSAWTTIENEVKKNNAPFTKPANYAVVKKECTKVEKGFWIFKRTDWESSYSITECTATQDCTEDPNGQDAACVDKTTEPKQEEPGRTAPALDLEYGCGDGIILENEKCDTGTGTITLEQLCDALPENCNSSDNDSLATFCGAQGWGMKDCTLETIVSPKRVCVLTVEGCNESNVQEFIGTGGKSCSEIHGPESLLVGTPICIMQGSGNCSFDMTILTGHIDSIEEGCTSCGNNVCDAGETSETCSADCASPEQ